MKENTVERPKPPEKKINTSNDFELAYLRHQYFRRVKYNPTEVEMAPYRKIVENLTKNTYFTYINLFKSVGMNIEDLFNIGLVQLVSFLGLYDINKTKEKKKEFAETFLRYKYREAEEKDFDQKNKANFTMFFKQRMEDLVRVCRQKMRNIRGVASEEYHVFCGKTKPPKQHLKLLKNFEEYEYKKIDFAIFKSIRKAAKVNHDATLFEFSGNWYVAIAVEQKDLEIDDLIGSDSNPYENSHNLQPDAFLEEKEEEESKGLYRRLFNRSNKCAKRVLLRKFIASNQKKKYYKKEIATARKLLRTLGG